MVYSISLVAPSCGLPTERWITAYGALRGCGQAMDQRLRRPSGRFATDPHLDHSVTHLAHSSAFFHHYFALVSSTSGCARLRCLFRRCDFSGRVFYFVCARFDR